MWSEQPYWVPRYDSPPQEVSTSFRAASLVPRPLCACSVSRDAGERPSIKCFPIRRINIGHETWKNTPSI